MKLLLAIFIGGALGVLFGVLSAAVPDQVEVVRQDSNIVILAVVTTVGTVVTAAISAIVAYFMAKLKAQGEASARADEITAMRAKEAADKAEEVRVSLQVNRAATDKKLDKIESRVNGGVEKLLRTSAIALRRVAATTKSPDDVKIAETAEETLAEHIKAQIQVDAAHPQVEVAQPEATPPKTVGLGQAVGDIAQDVKVIGEDVKAVRKATE